MSSAAGLGLSNGRLSSSGGLKVLIRRLSRWPQMVSTTHPLLTTRRVALNLTHTVPHRTLNSLAGLCCTSASLHAECQSRPTRSPKRTTNQLTLCGLSCPSYRNVYYHKRKLYSLTPASPSQLTLSP